MPLIATALAPAAVLIPIVSITSLCSWHFSAGWPHVPVEQE